MSNLIEYKLDLIAEALGAYIIRDVATAVRRQHTNEQDGEIVDVIDLYPSWNQYGTYGKHKVAHEYLDQPWQVERFEKHAGVKVSDMPLYEGQQAIQRTHGRPHKCEVQVRPFRLMLQPRKDENGNFDKTLILRYLPAGRTGQQETGGEIAPERPKSVVKPETNGRMAGKITDLRATIDGAANVVTLGFVADRAAMTGKYESAHKALKQMHEYGFPAGVKIEMTQKVSRAGALKVYDWLTSLGGEQQETA